MTGYARNSGLDFVMGEYLGFLDYDDLFHKNALLFAYTEAKKKNYTIVNFGFKRFNNESSITNELNDLNNNYNIEIVKENNNYPLGKVGIYVWSKIYKSTFILSHNFKFVNTWIDEDVLFCVLIFSYKFEILIINKKLVFHRLLSSSVAHNPKPNRKKFILFHLRNIFKNWEKKGMMKERLIVNSFNYIINSFFRNDLQNFLIFLKSFKTIFSNNEIKKLYINRLKMNNIEQLYLKNYSNINFYESYIKNEIKCFI